MKFYIVDAFTEELFGGNPAGVVLLGNADYPEDSLMVKTAAELRYSETAFVKKLGDKHFRARYFTPAAEVDLCGHATIALSGVLMEEGEVTRDDSFVLETMAGTLNVEINDGFIFMDMGKPESLGEIEDKADVERLAKIMGTSYENVICKPELVSTGLPDIMLGLASEEALNSLKPDFEALAAYSKEKEVVGVHAYCLDSGKDVTARCRNFAPLYDIDEEAATGTSNGALTYHLYKKGQIKEGQANVFIQGEAMDRPSKIMSRLTLKDGGELIQVGGVYKPLAKGEINL